MKKITRLFLGVCLMFFATIFPVNAGNDRISTFDELREYANESYDSYTSLSCVADELVLAEDLEIPENLCVYFYGTVIIPEGVTLTVNGDVYFYNDDLEIAGTLHVKGYTEIDKYQLMITGTLINDNMLRIVLPSNITGIENLQRGEGSIVAWYYFAGDAEIIKEFALQASNDATPNTYYIVDVISEEVVIEEDITIPENMTIYAKSMYLEECTVNLKGTILLNDMFVNGIINNEGEIHIANGLYVVGTLNNEGKIRVYDGGSITNAEGGNFIGLGAIILYGVEQETEITSIITGLDLSQYTATYAMDEYDNYCELRMNHVVDPVEVFVTRMYQQCLDRDPDQSGLDGWVGQLKNGNMNGAQIAEQFVFSNEMLSKNLSDEEFVNVLYRAMMGREADEAGRTGWVNQLSNGYMTRSEVTKSFVESTEFTEICTSYGITRGTYDASIAPIEHFVTRFYTLCLERKPDQAGLYGWVNNLKNQYMNGAQIAEQFFFSDEFIARNVSDEKYVELLYNTLLGRPSDENGKTGWLGQLQNGNMTRRDMMKAFIESDEFTDICETYGITRGSVD